MKSSTGFVSTDLNTIEKAVFLIMNKNIYKSFFGHVKRQQEEIESSCSQNCGSLKEQRIMKGRKVNLFGA